jgi:hypothetical protein
MADGVQLDEDVEMALADVDGDLQIVGYNEDIQVVDGEIDDEDIEMMHA